MYAGFEFLAVMTVKSATFWDVTPCRVAGVQRLFGGTYCLQLQEIKFKPSIQKKNFVC
jgi:hypothetical protein